jgi:hypothetical protein
MQTLRIAVLALTLSAFNPTAFAQAPAGAVPNPPAMDRIMGVVSAVNGPAITVTSKRNPNPETFTLAPNARIMLGANSTLSAILVNNPLRVMGKVSTDGTSIDARQIIILPFLPRRLKQPENKNSVTGTVTSLSPLQVTLATTPAVVVTINTQPNTRVRTIIAGDSSDIVVGSHLTAGVQGPSTALVTHEVMILPAGQGHQGRKNAAAGQNTF